MFLYLKPTNLSISLGYRNGCFYHGVQKGSTLEAIHLLETKTTLLETFEMDLFAYSCFSDRVFVSYILTLTFLNIHFHLKFT